MAAAPPTTAAPGGADPAGDAPGRPRRPAPGGRPGSWATVAAVAARPRLWATALAAGARLAPRGWWRRRPFLPLPDPAYLRFRVQTHTGDAARGPAPGDVVAYLDWCRRFAGLR